MAKEKTPSWAVDLLLMAAFLLALACSASVAAILRWRRLRKGIPQISHREINPLDLSSAEARNALMKCILGEGLTLKIYLASSEMKSVDLISEFWFVDLRARRNQWRLNASRNPSVLRLEEKEQNLASLSTL